MCVCVFMCIYSLGCYMPNHYSGVVEAPSHHIATTASCAVGPWLPHRPLPGALEGLTLGPFRVERVEPGRPSISINDTWYPPVI